MFIYSIYKLYKLYKFTLTLFNSLHTYLPAIYHRLSIKIGDLELTTYMERERFFLLLPSYADHMHGFMDLFKIPQKWRFSVRRPQFLNADRDRNGPHGSQTCSQLRLCATDIVRRWKK